MKSDTPLVFAAAAYKVTKGTGDRFEVEPIFVTPSGGTMEENLKFSPREAASVPTKWSRSEWPSQP